MVFCICALGAACTSTAPTAKAPKLDRATSELALAAEPDGPQRAVGKPYQIAGKWYEPKEDPTYDREGVASWYGPRFHGRRTANGEVFDRSGLTAAHPTLPLPSYVRVTNTVNDRSVVVRVNDRGPFSRTRLIDVSERTADLLGFKRAGMAPVRVQYVGRAKTGGGDGQFLLASYSAPDGTPPPQAVVLASSEDSRSSVSPRRREKPVQVAALVAPETVEPEKPPNTIAFTTAESRTDAPAAEATAAVSTPFGSDARISMAFDVISPPQD